MYKSVNLSCCEVCVIAPYCTSLALCLILNFFKSARCSAMIIIVGATNSVFNRQGVNLHNRKNFLRDNKKGICGFVVTLQL